MSDSRRSAVGRRQYLEKIKDLKTGKGVQPSTEAYINIVTLIRNLKITKRITQEKVTYTLVSTYNQTDEDYGDFFKKLEQAVSFWKITNHRRWVNALVDAAVKTIEAIAI